VPLGIRDSLNIVPIHFITIPGLEFVEDSLDYYERHLFKRHILRLPHPSFYRQLSSGLFQDPRRMEVIYSADLPDIDYTDVLDMARKQEGLDDRAAG
jgi:hypothetical protein